MIKRHAVSEPKKVGARKLFLIATNPRYSKLCAQSLKRLPARSNVKLHSFAAMDDAALSEMRGQSTLFVSRLADFTEASLERFSAGSNSRQLVFLEGLPVEAVASRLAPLNIRNPERLHIAAERDDSSIAELIHRAVSGWARRDCVPSVVDAWIESDKLVLLSPSFARLEVPLERLRRFIGDNQKRVAAFELDEDGRYLFWPHADVHMGWAQFQQLIDPTLAIRDQQSSAKFNERYGAAIRALREDAGLKQSDIKGFTERQLRRVEHGEQAASKAVLSALAEAHSQALDEYLASLAKVLIQDRQTK